jgi:hypothetical protein
VKELKQAGISKIVIERPHKKCRVTIHGPSWPDHRQEGRGHREAAPQAVGDDHSGNAPQHR